MSNLPKDGATLRLHRLNHLVEFCASFSTKGCTTIQLMKEGQLEGNTSNRVLEYITLLVNWGLIKRIADRYYVDELNYIEWAEAKGFREQVYIYKCQNPECQGSYSSKSLTCPTCHAPNPLFSNEPRGYTHTQINSIPQNTDEKATNLNTHTHTKRQNRPKIGKDAEKRVVKFLSAFGEARLGVGQNGRPDVLFTSGRAGYGVEVRSVEHQVRAGVDRFKAGCVAFSVGAWLGLCGFCEVNDLVPLLVVEVRIRGSNKGPMYHFVPREVVDGRIAGFRGKNLRVSVLDLPGMSIQSIREGLPMVGEFRL